MAKSIVLHEEEGRCIYCTIILLMVSHEKCVGQKPGPNVMKCPNAVNCVVFIQMFYAFGVALRRPYDLARRGAKTENGNVHLYFARFDVLWFGEANVVRATIDWYLLYVYVLASSPICFSFLSLFCYSFLFATSAARARHAAVIRRVLNATHYRLYDLLWQ